MKLSLLLLLISLWCNVTTFSQAFVCPNLDELIDYERVHWKSYEFIMGDCLMERFIELAKGKQVDFRPLLEKLEQNVLINLRLLEQELQVTKDKIAEQSTAFNNKMRHEVKVKNAERQFKRNKSMLNRMLESVRVRVTLAKGEINSQMEKCLLSGALKKVDKDFRYSQSCTSQQINKTIDMALKLYKQLDAQNALQELDHRLRQLNIAQASA